MSGKKSVLEAFILFCFLLFLGCNRSEAKFIQNLQLNEFLGKHEDASIVDVRKPHELKGHLGNIVNSVNVPLQTIGANIEKYVPNKKDHIVLVCRTHNRSQIAYRKLK